MNIRGLIVVLLAIALALVGCASSQKSAASLETELARQGYAMGDQVSSIRDWRLNGWTYVDDEHFVMRSGVNDYYLVTLKTPCFDLRGAFSLSFTTTAASLTDKDRVAIHSSPAGFREVYLIEALHELRKIERPGGAG